MNKHDFLRQILDHRDDGIPLTRMAKGRLAYSPFHGKSYYFLMQSIEWVPDTEEGKAFKKTKVPKGFVTDFASVPRAFWGVFPPVDKYAYAAVVHDFLYWTQTTSREYADGLFKLCMQEMGVPGPTIFSLYNSVRLAGGRAWKNNELLKAGGERRLLKFFPKNQLTTWEDWKSDPSVFAARA